jgi:hypothetical protein
MLSTSLQLPLYQPEAGDQRNIVDPRTIESSVRNFKNALFYRTLNGAEVGDLFMSLIHTCQLRGANSFDYLIELQRHAKELATSPAEWMPWNYQEVVSHADTGHMGKGD